MAGLRTAPFWRPSPHVAMVEARCRPSNLHLHLHLHPSLRLGAVQGRLSSLLLAAAAAATHYCYHYYYYYHYYYNHYYYYYYYHHYQAQLRTVAAELMILSPLDAPWDNLPRQSGAGAPGLGLNPHPDPNPKPSQGRRVGARDATV